MDKAQLIKSINNGDFDDSLEQIEQICRDRLKSVRKASARAAEPGDDVRLVNLSPKYLTEFDATFVRVKDTKRVIVKLEPAAKFGKGYGRYYQDDLQLAVPLTSIEVV